MRPYAVVSFAVLALTGSPAPLAQPIDRDRPAPRAPSLPTGLIDLRPRFEPGQKTRLRMTMTSAGTAPNLTSLDLDNILDEPTPSKKPAPAKPTKPGGPNDPNPHEPQLKTSQEFVLVFDVKDAGPNRDSIVDVVFESIKATSESAEGKHEFDSTKPTKSPTPANPPAPTTPGLPGNFPPGFDDPLTAALRPLVGSKVTLTIDPSGNIKDAAGGSEWSGLAGLMGGGSPGDLFRGIVSPTSAPGLVRVGQSWDTASSIKTGLIGEFRMTTQSRLVSHKDRLARVDFTGKISPGSEGGPGDGSFQVKESNYKGRYDWDTQRGFLKSMSSEQSIRIDAGMLGTVEHQQSVKAERID